MAALANRDVRRRSARTIARASAAVRRRVAARSRLRTLLGRPGPPDLATARLLRAFADVHPSATFVEIGSNDGEQHDHLRPFILAHDWHGVMVEPVPYIFERLRRNYGHLSRIRLENAAVDDADGVRPFFHLVDATAEERADLPDWYDGIGSFSKEFVLGHAAKVPGLEGRLVSTAVPTLTFASLCRRHGLGRVDLLVVDTEGHDWEVIRRLDLAEQGPELIVYEHFHLRPPERAAASARLQGAGYLTMEEGFDTLCLSTDAHPRLRALWRTLRPGVAGVSVSDEAR